MNKLIIRTQNNILLTITDEHRLGFIPRAGDVLKLMRGTNLIPFRVLKTESAIPNNGYIQVIVINDSLVTTPLPVLTPEDLAIIQTKKDIAFGNTLILQFSAADNDSGMTSEQVYQMSEEFAPLMRLLQSGALDTFVDVVTSWTLTGYMTQDIKDQFIGAVRAYKGLT
jgi:hypothetical protein